MLRIYPIVAVMCFSALVHATAVQPIDHEKYVLQSNGLEVILHHDARLPLVAVNVWYHTGPINEPKGRTGFAHLFEHLMFQGSAHVADDQHIGLLQSIGAADLNGTTGNDRTNYYETVPANQLDVALWLESDRMGFLLEALTQENLNNQRDVVMNERRQSVENRPYGLSDEKMIQTLYPKGHPYFGNVIGSMDDLRSATLEDVRDFFISYYAPSNATLVVAGDFDPSTVKATVAQYFASLPRRKAPKTIEVQTPTITQERRVIVREPVALPRIQMGWLSAPYFSEKDAQADVLAYILGAGKSSRLYRKLVYDLELAQDVSATQYSSALNSIFLVTATGRPGVAIKKIEAAMEQVLSDFIQQGPTDAELNRARNMLTTGTLSSLQRIGRVADTLNRYNQYLDAPGALDRDLARYNQITHDNLRTLAATMLKPTARVVVMTEPVAPSRGNKS